MLVRYLLTSIFIFVTTNLHAETQPKFSIIPTTSTSVTLTSTQIGTIQYRVTNQTALTRRLTMISIPGIAQVIAGPDYCSNPFTLAHGQSCLLTLQAIGSRFSQGTTNKPVEVCKTNLNNNSPDPFLCSQTSQENNLNITNNSTTMTATNVQTNLSDTLLNGNVTQDASNRDSVAPANTAVALTTEESNTGSDTAAIEIHESQAQITITPHIRFLTVSGAAGDINITNLSSTVTATNIQGNLSDTALNGNLTQNPSGCVSLAPQQTCTLTFTPSATAVSLTSFAIQGDNTTPAGAAIQITSPSIADISVSGSSLVLTAGGSSGTLTVTNNSTTVATTDVQALLSPQAAAVVTQNASDCVSLAPGASCSLVFTPVATLPSTAVTITGTNASQTSAVITVNGAQRER